MSYTATPQVLVPGGGLSFRPQRSHIPEYFVATQIVSQFLLLLGPAGSLRIALRILEFAFSLALLVLVQPALCSKPHPSRNAALLVLAIVGLEWFHPYTNTAIAGMAQAAMYAAILGPLFWIPHLSLDMSSLRRIILILFVFHVASAGTGLLQIYFPDRFQPPVSSVITANPVQAEGLKITLDSGRRVFRPLGLSDTPGGAGVSGMFAILFGLAFLLIERNWLIKAACLGAITLGLAAIYLSEVRSALVVVLIWLVALAAFMVRSKNWKQLGTVVMGLLLVAVLGFHWATSIAGKSVTKRFSNLSSNAGKVYESQRGHFFEDTFNVLLPRYPLGAGLARYGMMNYYFGNNDNPKRAAIWVEIQWTAWVLDGGIPLTLAYVAGLALCFVSAVRLLRRRGALGMWAAIILSYDIGIISNTLDYSPFVGQMGLEFWLLNALLIAAAQSEPDPRMFLPMWRR